MSKLILLINKKKRKIHEFFHNLNNNPSSRSFAEITQKRVSNISNNGPFTKHVGERGTGLNGRTSRESSLFTP